MNEKVAEAEDPSVVITNELRDTHRSYFDTKEKLPKQQPFLIDESPQTNEQESYNHDLNVFKENIFRKCQVKREINQIRTKNIIQMKYSFNVFTKIYRSARNRDIAKQLHTRSCLYDFGNQEAIHKCIKDYKEEIYKNSNQDE